MAHASGHGTELALETIGAEWGKSDPAGALEFAVTKAAEGGYKLANAALKSWTESDLDEAAKWIADADEPVRNRLSPTFVEEWAKKDALSALNWCESNLAGSTLSAAVGGVLRGAAEKDVAEAAKLVAGMNPSSARAEAALAVAEKWLPHWSAEDRKVTPEAIAWLAGLDRESVIRVVEEAQWCWSRSDPNMLKDFLASYGAENMPAHVYTIAVRHLVGKNPIEAIEWADSLPESNRIPVGARAFSEWRSAQFELAMNWLNELPQSDPRRKTFFRVAVEDMAYDSRAPQHLAAMSEADRMEALAIIAAAPLPEEKRAKLLRSVEDFGSDR
jgi:hypothetical protein